MVNIQQLIDAAKMNSGIPSNYRLARVLGVTDQTVRNWTHARGLPDDKTAARLAEMAGLDPALVVASMHAARAATEVERGLWTRIVERLGGVAAAVLVGTMLSAPTPAPARINAESATEPLYLMSTQVELTG